MGPQPGVDVLSTSRLLSSDHGLSPLEGENCLSKHILGTKNRGAGQENVSYQTGGENTLLRKRPKKNYREARTRLQFIHVEHKSVAYLPSKSPSVVPDGDPLKSAQILQHHT